MKTPWIILILMLAGASGFLLSAFLHARSASPAYVEPERTFHYPMTFVKHLEGKPHQGKLIYQAYCASCHAPHPSIPLSAPLLGDKAAWAPYQKIGLENLLKMAAHGNGGMPARGGCFECSDEYLKKAIQYILDQSR